MAIKILHGLNTSVENKRNEDLRCNVSLFKISKT